MKSKTWQDTYKAKWEELYAQLSPTDQTAVLAAPDGATSAELGRKASNFADNLTAQPSTEAKHTPGPWKVRPYKNADNDIWIDCDAFKGAGALGGTLATAHARGTGNGTVEANAALIAAAPELLEALQVLLLAYDTTKPGASVRAGAEAKARAAISKATR